MEKLDFSSYVPGHVFSEVPGETTERSPAIEKNADRKIYFSVDKAEEDRNKVIKIIRKIEEKYLKLFEASPFLITITRLDDNCIIEANESAVKRMGGNKEDIIGHPLQFFEENSDLEESESKFRNMQETGYVFRGEYKYKNINGKEIFLAQTRQIIEVDGEKCVLTISEDITEQKQLQQQLLQTRKMDALGKLTAGIAHDFNNMLSVIIGYSDSTLRFTSKDPKTNENIEQIKNAAERAAALTSQLLAFRKQFRERVVIVLNEYRAEVKEIIRNIIGEDIEFELYLEPGLKDLYSDKNQIDRIIVNLVTNSKQAMPEGGKLAVKIENVTLNKETCRDIPYSRAGEFICISVLDTGVGISPEQMEHLFEPYYMTNFFSKSSGLGLFVVYGIVKQQEGWINVNSSLGKGTEFKIYFPAYKEKEGIETRKEEFSEEHKYGNGKSMFVVEKNNTKLTG